MAIGDFWRNRRVLVTGHTGFKGGWLASWLLKKGALVCGYALEPEPGPSYYSACALADLLESVTGDIRDSEKLGRTLDAFKPEVIFHLAAQSLVLRSYRHPLETFSVNVMGTASVLETVRHTPSVRAIVVATSDKCYENREWHWGYRETDELGGRDPYSASKACAELVTHAYRRSFFEARDTSCAVATVRAGNVIGGGDWAEDRIVPDAVRALSTGKPLAVRNPRSVRPWQHVLEPLAGYLVLAQRLFSEGHKWAGPWNFGPSQESTTSVAELVEKVFCQWGARRVQWSNADSLAHEAGYLHLDNSKARSLLEWHPVLTVDEAISVTVEWYRAFVSEKDANMFEVSCKQIAEYEARLTEPALSA